MHVGCCSFGRYSFGCCGFGCPSFRCFDFGCCEYSLWRRFWMLFGGYEHWMLQFWMLRKLDATLLDALIATRYYSCQGIIYHPNFPTLGRSGYFWCILCVGGASFLLFGASFLRDWCALSRPVTYFTVRPSTKTSPPPNGLLDQPVLVFSNMYLV